MAVSFSLGSVRTCLFRVAKLKERHLRACDSAHHLTEMGAPVNAYMDSFGRFIRTQGVTLVKKGSAKTFFVG